MKLKRSQCGKMMAGRIERGRDEPSTTTIKYYHGNIYIKCRLQNVIFCHRCQRERCDSYKEHDGIWHRSWELHRSSRLILFQMEMLNFAYISEFFLYARMLCQFSRWFKKWQHTPKRQWSLTRSLTTHFTLTLNAYFSIWFPFSMFVF